MTVETDVREFHELAKQANSFSPHILDGRSFARRTRLILEELTELCKAQAENDVVEFADACADLVYVVVGTAVEAGIPFDACWAEVQRSNMSKRGGYLDASGKFVKPPTYIPANIEKVLEEHHANAAHPSKP